MNIPKSHCCKNCTFLAKLIEFGNSKNYELVCTLFTDPKLSYEPYIIRTTEDSLCEMFTEKTGETV